MSFTHQVYTLKNIISVDDMSHIITEHERII